MRRFRRSGWPNSAPGRVSAGAQRTRETESWPVALQTRDTPPQLSCLAILHRTADLSTLRGSGQDGIRRGLTARRRFASRRRGATHRLAGIERIRRASRRRRAAGRRSRRRFGCVPSDAHARTSGACGARTNAGPRGVCCSNPGVVSRPKTLPRSSTPFAASKRGYRSGSSRLLLLVASSAFASYAAMRRERTARVSLVLRPAVTTTSRANAACSNRPPGSGRFAP